MKMRYSISALLVSSPHSRQLISFHTSWRYIFYCSRSHPSIARPMQYRDKAPSVFGATRNVTPNQAIPPILENKTPSTSTSPSYPTSAGSLAPQSTATESPRMQPALMAPRQRLTTMTATTARPTPQTKIPILGRRSVRRVHVMGSVFRMANAWR